LIPTPPILVSSSEVVLEQKPRGKSPLAHLALGQKVTAKVLEVISDRRALLMIGGQRVNAKTFLPLQAGQTVLLRMDRTGNRQVFKFEGVAEGGGPDQRLPMGLFGKSQPYVMFSRLLEELPGLKAGGGDIEASRHLKVLRELVSGLGLKSDVPSHGFLKRLMDTGGLLWESKMAALVSKGDPPTPAAVQRLVSGDLKALVLQLLSDAKVSSAPEAFTEHLKGTLEGLEHHQLLNQHLLENEGRYLLPLLVGGQPPFQFGQLLLGLGDRKEGAVPEERVVTVSFLLTLSNLGELRADVSILKDRLTGAFGVADEANRELIIRYLPELRRKLRDHGFGVCDITCRVLEPEQLSEMSLVTQAMASPEDGFFNLVV